MTQYTSILIVDDHKSYAEGLLAILLKNFPAYDMTMAHSAESAVSVLESNGPFGLVITDISMGEMSGIELVRVIKRQYPATKVLVLSMHNEKEMVRAIMDAEAEGYIVKNSSAAEVVTAVTDILNNSTHYGREVLNALVQNLREEKKRAAAIEILSARELEVLKLILDEYSSDAIAQKLFISKRTVDAHRVRILEKTRCSNLVALIKFAIQNNLVQGPIGTNT